ncbi:MAG: long-chain fatty acid--CoA ligase [Bacteroidales bacterium]|nr:long-chain fatty acid--CoA ligase [Bacteroidales bacterium]
MAHKYVLRDFSKFKDVTRVFDLLDCYKENNPHQQIALGGKNTGSWVTYSPDEYKECACNISYALMTLGVQAGDKVALISSSRPEWNMIDMGVQQIGAILVPVYPTISENDYRYILNHCEAKVVIMEGAEVMKKITAVKADLPNVEHFYTFQDRKDYPYFEQLVELGKNNPNPEELQRRKDAVKPTDCCTIVYTSGTTGTPKGVMLAHCNLISQVKALKTIPSASSTRALSFLPLSHVYERMLIYLYQYLGMSVYYAQNLGTIAENIKEIRPTMMTCVPRVWEKFYDKIYDNGKKMKGFSQKIFYWAVDVAKAYRIEKSDRPFGYGIKYAIAKKLVFDKIYAGIGGDFDVVVSGSAAIPSNLVSFFNAIGMTLFEGYGLTETSPVVAVHTRDKFGREAGTVGPGLAGTEVKISEKGEVICRGHNVMMGYYKAPELTAEVIDEDGWFHTGDLGHFNERNQLVLTGRIKSLFKTAMGKYVNPQVIEERMSTSPFIENMVVVGEGQKFAGAVISPNFEYVKTWCAANGITYTSPAEIIKEKAVFAQFRKEIDTFNKEFGDTEQIKKFALVAEPWGMDNGFLTPTLKVKRGVVENRYKEEIAKLFV